MNIKTISPEIYQAEGPVVWATKENIRFLKERAAENPRGRAQLRGGPRQISTTVAELIRKEETGGFDRAQTFRDFNRRIDEIKNGLDAVLREMESRGETLAGYGAARGGTTLLYRLDLERRIRFIVDDGPSKQGLFSPGHHIPIRSPDALYSEKPEYLMILAWVHSKAIMQNHKRHLDQGGRFLLSYPRVEVVSANSSLSPK